MTTTCLSKVVLPRLQHLKFDVPVLILVATQQVYQHRFGYLPHGQADKEEPAILARYAFQKEELFRA
jgi:hypothetical protein